MSKEVCYTINSMTCIECGTCRRYCPVENCITFFDDYQHKINLDKCIGCGICEAFCPIPATVVPIKKVAPRPQPVLKSQRQTVWRMKWHYENHPLVGAAWRRVE